MASTAQTRSREARCQENLLRMVLRRGIPPRQLPRDGTPLGACCARAAYLSRAGSLSVEPLHDSQNVQTAKAQAADADAISKTVDIADQRRSGHAAAGASDCHSSLISQLVEEVGEIVNVASKLDRVARNRRGSSDYSREDAVLRRKGLAHRRDANWCRYCCYTSAVL